MSLYHLKTLVGESNRDGKETGLDSAQKMEGWKDTSREGKRWGWGHKQVLCIQNEAALWVEGGHFWDLRQWMDNAELKEISRGETLKVLWCLESVNHKDKVSWCLLMNWCSYNSEQELHLHRLKMCTQVWKS